MDKNTGRGKASLDTNSVPRPDDKAAVRAALRNGAVFEYRDCPANDKEAIEKLVREGWQPTEILTRTLHAEYIRFRRSLAATAQAPGRLPYVVVEDRK